MEHPEHLSDQLELDNFATRVSNWLSDWHPHWCLDWYKVARIICILSMSFVLWGTAFAWFGDDAKPPYGQFFGLGLLATTSFFVGFVIGEITPIPSVYIMLLFGILFRNIELYTTKGSYVHMRAALRHLDVMVILIRAGLGLDHRTLVKLGGMVWKLSIIPATVEMITMTIMGYVILDMPPGWSLLLGCVISPVSPTVVIPAILRLNKKGYACSKDMSALIITTTGLEDVYAISIYEITDAIMEAQESVWDQILYGPIAILSGIIYGFVFGFLACFIPHYEDRYVVPLRIIFITSGCLLAIFGTPLIEFESAGPIACMVIAYVSSYGWTLLGFPEENLVLDTFKLIWYFIQAFLFPLMGAEIYFKELWNDELAKIFALVLLCAVLRWLSCFCVTIGGIYDVKERIFLAVSLIPKASVQAALGPVALDFLRFTDHTQEIQYAWNIMIAAVFSILLTAPIGGILIPVCGKLLLEKEVDKQVPTRTSIMGTQLR